MSQKVELSNWGNYPRHDVEWHEPSFPGQLSKITEQLSHFIPRGNGRCYGDAALSDRVVSTLQLDNILGFDSESGVIHCQAGVLLSKVLEFSVAKGFFLPVTPGTKFITVGGAVAADVHGKNHHVDGCFSEHVLFFDLLTPEGEVVRCSKHENDTIFWLTCGGMGLTGTILSVAFKLKAIETAYIKQRTIKAQNLEEVFALFEEYQHRTYSVAWVDCLATGKHLGRSLLMVGEHAEMSELPGKQLQKPLKISDSPKLNFPINLPSFVLNRLSVGAFNWLYFNRILKKEQEDIIHYEPFFYPLDAILNWNRMYGKEGFTQYQFVLPKENSVAGMETILNKIAKSGLGSFLVVLKLFGPENEKSILGFPMEGYTLALDFKMNPQVLSLLDELDKVVEDHGGRIYLAKDARMTKTIFQNTYEKLPQFIEKLQKLDPDGKLQSLLSKRLGLNQ